MASLFEELLSLDRPFLDVELEIGKTKKTVKVRRPSAEEADALDAFFADEYADYVIRETEPEKPGTELERLRLSLKKATREDLIEQLVASRGPELQRLGMERSGFNLGETALKLAYMNDDERKQFETENEERLNEGLRQAKAEIAAEYEAKPVEELAETLAQITLNFKAQVYASRLQRSEFLAYAVHDSEGNKAFENAAAVRQLGEDTINAMFTAVQKALRRGDLPFESPGAVVPGGQPSSPDTSAEATKAGGKRTQTRKRGSKQSTSLASTT